MSFKEITELINIIDKSQISFMELNYEKVYLKLDKSLNRGETTNVKDFNNQVKINDKNYGVETEEICDVVKENVKNTNENVNDVLEEDENVQYILSPMVGTVYLAPSPGKQTYVSKDQDIKNGDVVCIIEAMKLMNEIESEYSGKVIEILVKNSQMVEYGQKLFKIKKS